MPREELKTLSEPMFYILLALYEPRYGLEISNYISEITEGRIILPPGTLYGLLSRFEQENYIELVKSKSKRKVYLITELGQALLHDEYSRIQKMIFDFDKEKMKHD